MSIDKSKLDSACKHLMVDSFNYEEYAFLCEYRDVIELVAAALKSIESNSYTFGLYLPTLFGLKFNLQKMIDEKLVSDCIPLINALLNGIDARFGNLLDPFSPDQKSVPLFIAMMTNPKFKLRYMGLKENSSDVLSKLKEMLVSEAIRIDHQNVNENKNGDNSDAHDKGNNLKFIV